jgi:hypothetical protein
MWHPLRLLAVFLSLLAIGPAAPLAASPLRIWWDPDGTTYLENTTDSPISFDGYQFESEAKGLDPVGWRSIADQVAADPLAVIAALGAGAISFGEANPGNSSLAELNIAGAATLQPRARFSIGKPFRQFSLWGPDSSTAFWYHLPGTTSAIRGDFIVVPEPTTWLLLLIGSAAMLAGKSTRRLGLRGPLLGAGNARVVPNAGGRAHASEGAP